MKHILAVDDSSSNLQMVKNSLQPLYSVTLVNNGERALSYLENKHPDLILLDVMMPGLDGVETLSRIKTNADWKDIPVVMLTAMPDCSYLDECIDLGAEAVVAKPFMPKSLVSTIEHAMASRMCITA